MTRLYFLFSLFFCFSLFAAFDPELQHIVDNAKRSGHPWVIQALEYEQRFREATIAELHEMLQDIQVTAHAKSVDAEHLRVSLVAAFEHDLKRIAVLKHYTSKKNPAAIQTHKLQEATLGALAFVKTPGVVGGLLLGQLPTGYAMKQSDITRLGDNSETIFGNSKGTFLRTALFKIQMFLKNKTHFSELEPAIGTSVLCYQTRSQFSAAELEQIGDIPYVCATGLYYPHSGYAFGGSRNDVSGNEFVPEDCSSFVAKMTLCSIEFTTADEFECYNPSPAWAKTPTGKAMLKMFEPTDDIQPGVVLCARSQLGGHTTFVLGQRQNGKLITLGCNRNMPSLEGTGIEEIVYRDTPERRIVFLKKRDTNICMPSVKRSVIPNCPSQP